MATKSPEIAILGKMWKVLVVNEIELRPLKQVIALNCGEIFRVRPCNYCDL